jgi:DNA-binding CsgD family transcriptional regulator
VFAGTNILQLTFNLLKRNGKVFGISVFGKDITDRRQTEKELLEKSKALEELNIALKVLIDQYKNDQRELEERIVSNIRVRIIPYLEKFKQTRLDIGQSALIEIIERSFRDISSPFLKLISSEHFRFTPKEIEIVSLIKDGKTTKEIAQVLRIGKRTADSYRDNIRGKLGLANKKINLRTYLLSIANT